MEKVLIVCFRIDIQQQLRIVKRDKLYRVMGKDGTRAGVPFQTGEGGEECPVKQNRVSALSVDGCRPDGAILRVLAIMTHDFLRHLHRNLRLIRQQDDRGIHFSR